MPENMKNALTFLGRILFSLIFVIAGIGKIMHFPQMSVVMASKGIPYADAVLILSIIMELGGGLMVMIGWYARLGALLLFLFIIPVTFVFHSFWTFEPAEAAAQMQNFLKNISILGAALYIMIFGPGGWSLNRR